MKKQFYFSLFLGLVAVFSFAFVSSAQAAALTTVTITPDTFYGGRVTNYTVSFVVGSSTEIAAKIRLIFPTGFDVSNATATSSMSASSGGSSVIADSTVSGQELTIVLADGAVTPINDTIEISGIPSIKNPAIGGSFTLGVQTRTAGDDPSDSASSTAFTIFGSSAAKVSADTSPPSSTITRPASGATITAGEKYVIEGTGADAEGSAVTTVEVSVDDGTTWFFAPSNSSGGLYNWNYVWENPTAGDYTIKVRATDVKGNAESPSAGVKVTVTGSVSPTPTPTPPPAQEKPIAQMTISELQTTLVQVQQQLLGLLKQLVLLLTAQL